MKTKPEIDAMRKQAYIEQLRAKDLTLAGRATDKTVEAKAFAEGVECALLWVLGGTAQALPADLFPDA